MREFNRIFPDSLGLNREEDNYVTAKEMARNRWANFLRVLRWARGRPSFLKRLSGLKDAVFG